jgi:hypothetical protein
METEKENASAARADESEDVGRDTGSLPQTHTHTHKETHTHTHTHRD